MKIKKIKNIDFTAFNNFHWDNSVPEFHDKVNIFLGWNGTGKTIISRLLRAYEKGKIDSQDKIADAKFAVDFNNEIKKHNNLSGFENKIRVFNEDYIQEIIGKTHLDYVVALGKPEVDSSKKEIELAEAEKELREMKTCENKYDEIAKNTADDIRHIPGIGHIKKESVVEGTGSFVAYFKDTFIKRIEWFDKKIQSKKKIDDFIQSDIELEKLKRELSNSEEKENEYNLLKNCNDWIIEELEDINQTLQFTPTYKKSERLGKYQDFSKEGKWIRVGVEVHKLRDEDNQLTNCLFCNSLIANQNELLKHFSDDVTSLNKTIEDLDNKIDKFAEEILSCKTFYDQKQNSISNFFTKLREKIAEKRKTKQSQ